MLKPEENHLRGKELLLMSFLTDLSCLGSVLAELSDEEVSLNGGVLQSLSESLSWVQTGLTERLTSVLKTNQDGSGSDVTSGSAATHFMENDIG